MKDRFSNQKFEKERLQKTSALLHFNQEKFNQKLELERIYKTKRKEFIIKTKKEIEDEKKKEEEKKHSDYAIALRKAEHKKRVLEREFEKLSLASKNFENKKDYVLYFDSLK